MAALLLAFSGLAAASASTFLGKVTVAEVERSLAAELNVSSHRLQELEAALRPMYAALPKEPSGHLGHQTVRYALHRLLLQRHGWFVVGLEPSDEALPPYLNGEWVPQYLQGLLEQRLGGRGVDLRDVAALAASLEDLVRGEVERRVDLVYQLLQEPTDARVGDAGATRLLETYMMMFLDDGNFSSAGGDLDAQRAAFKLEYEDWEHAATLLREIKGQHLAASPDAKLGKAEVLRAAADLGEHFGAFNDGECRELKQELLAIEGSRPGRVPLKDFYNKGLYSHWQFNERRERLRALGALDESDPQQPALVLPNYLLSRPNCLPASNLYDVCCRNECEDLMAQLERTFAAPAVAPQRILDFVAKLPSQTVQAPRELEPQLATRLRSIAVRHGGHVLLHGRLFAQWMHHAFPRECPYPQESEAPQTPDAWLDEAELPWSDAEVLLTPTPAPSQHEPLIPALLMLAVAGAVRAWVGLAWGGPAQALAAVVALVGTMEGLGLMDRWALGGMLAVGLVMHVVVRLTAAADGPSKEKYKSCV